ncbi:STAS domain-containing protein [Actinophytocola sp.]|jgi:anti-anti-sigma factor|uniref:STAS domain-containing protein n=1 Tax=Actinophytocola sp. TaxID=1872138 RepID=UPI002ED895BC
MSRDPLAPDAVPGSDPFGVTVNVEHRAGAVVLRVGGELDMLTTPKLQASIADALLDQPAVLVLDLAKVTFLASSAMAAIVEAHQAGADRTAVRVVAGGRETARPLEVAGLDGYLSVHPTLDAALAT